MPVYKYRDVSEMPDDTWHEPGDPLLFHAMRATWHVATRTTPVAFPPGVYKHPSMAAADALREKWDDANLKALLERRAADRTASTRRSPASSS